MHYTFYNGFILEFEFKKTNFPHMAGLHKLKDINIIQTYLGKQGFANQIISKIKKGALTEADIRTSKYFPGIQKRYEEVNDVCGFRSHVCHCKCTGSENL